jgi:hypothetical protein
MSPLGDRRPAPDSAALAATDAQLREIPVRRVSPGLRHGAAANGNSAIPAKKAPDPAPGTGGEKRP